MRSRIKIYNVQYFVRQEYGFKNLKQFFDYSKNAPKLHHEAMAKIVKEFTGYELVNGKLKTFNPYTSQYEELQIKAFAHIKSTEDLMKDLSMFHKTRMRMLTQSRKRILELSKMKKDTRDKDLLEEANKSKQRLDELNTLSESKAKSNELER